MSDWPKVDYGHTPYDAAMVRGDVYAVKPTAERAGKRPLRIALAGFGGVAQSKWLPAIRRLQTMGEPVEIAGIADPGGEARAKAGVLGCGAVFPTLGELIAAERPDLVLVLSADAAHAPLATIAIDAGIPALIEKPLAPDAATAAALVARAATKGVLLAAVANKRFSPPYRTARALVESGRLNGAPTLFTGKFTLGYPYVDLLRGGTVHLLDLALWFMGPALNVHARGIHRDGMLESAVVSLAFAGGAIGTIMTSAAGLSFKPWERVEIFGRNAFLVVDDQYELTLFDEETGPAKTWRPAIPNTLLFDESFGGYAPLLEHVLDAVRGLVPLEVPARDGANAVALIEAIERSIREKTPIDVRPEGSFP